MIELIIAFVCLAVPFALIGLWWWFWLMIAIAALVGIVELLAVIIKKKTISEMFREWSEQHKSKAWMVLASLLTGWISLLLHLAWKMLFKKEEERT